MSSALPSVYRLCTVREAAGRAPLNCGSLKASWMQNPIGQSGDDKNNKQIRFCFGFDFGTAKASMERSDQGHK